MNAAASTTGLREHDLDALGGAARPSRPPLGPDRWVLRDRAISLQKPCVMGILNLTPDSFSDGGAIDDPGTALRLAREMVEAGAAIIDVGGESTRPGAEPVTVAEELARILPFIELAAPELAVPISVDTRKAAVAEVALAAGASIINDVSGLRHDPALAGVAARSAAGLVLMHMRGEPADMRERAIYADLGAEVCEELALSVGAAVEAGVEPSRIVVDPGIGFAKSADHSLELIRDLAALAPLERPVMVGPSRKSFLGAVLGVPPSERLAGTVAACVLADLAGARLFRVHDVTPVVQALTVARAVRAAGAPDLRTARAGRGPNRG